MKNTGNKILDLLLANSLTFVTEPSEGDTQFELQHTEHPYVVRVTNSSSEFSHKENPKRKFIVGSTEAKLKEGLKKAETFFLTDVVEKPAEAPKKEAKPKAEKKAPKAEAKPETIVLVDCTITMSGAIDFSAADLAQSGVVALGDKGVQFNPESDFVDSSTEKERVISFVGKAPKGQTSIRDGQIEIKFEFAKDATETVIEAKPAALAPKAKKEKAEPKPKAEKKEKAPAEVKEPSCRQRIRALAAEAIAAKKEDKAARAEIFETLKVAYPERDQDSLRSQIALNYNQVKTGK